jgi:hypothetical protein
VSRPDGARRRVLAGLLACCACGMYGTGAHDAAAVRAAIAVPGNPPAGESPALDGFFDELEHRTFRFFWDAANPTNGLVPDRYPTPTFVSIAAVGFGLTAYPIGVERGYISRAAARERVLATLRLLEREPNQRGFFHHFIDMQTGARVNNSEVSTVDTALLLGGVLFCESYFDSREPQEVELRKMADEIYRRVNWTWAQRRAPAIALAWTPERGFSNDDWQGYNEAMLVYLLALGSPTHPVGERAWGRWTRTYDRYWGTLYGETYLAFGPLFGHQYTHVWVDFRGIRDAYMRAHDLDYFENSRRAAYAQRRYAIANPGHWQAYGENVWGLTACDGPGPARQLYEGEERRFFKYAARGVGLGRIIDDGTIAPTAALSSLPFAPEIVIPAALEMHQRFGSSIYSTYGFRDAFNPSFTDSAHQASSGDAGWVDRDYLGIDQGPILAMIENYRTDLVWRVMRGNAYIRRGLTRAGFSGGWLDKAGESGKGEK